VLLRSVDSLGGPIDEVEDAALLNNDRRRLGEAADPPSRSTAVSLTARCYCTERRNRRYWSITRRAGVSIGQSLRRPSSSSPATDARKTYGPWADVMEGITRGRMRLADVGAKDRRECPAKAERRSGWGPRSVRARPSTLADRLACTR
jgi:hypothetical protein